MVQGDGDQVARVPAHQHLEQAFQDRGNILKQIYNQKQIFAKYYKFEFKKKDANLQYNSNITRISTQNDRIQPPLPGRTQPFPELILSEIYHLIFSFGLQKSYHSIYTKNKGYQETVHPLNHLGGRYNPFNKSEIKSRGGCEGPV